jgi:hypothetical protein
MKIIKLSISLLIFILASCATLQKGKSQFIGAEDFCKIKAENTFEWYEVWVTKSKEHKEFNDSCVNNWGVSYTG